MKVKINQIQRRKMEKTSNSVETKQNWIATVWKRKEIGKNHIETKENVDKSYQSLWDTVKLKAFIWL